MGRPPITAKGKLREKQLDAALDYIEENSGGGSSAWASITGKPSTFPPETHSHAQSDVTGLTTALAGKASTTHSHAIADVTGLQTALDGKQASGAYADASHTHSAATTSVAGFLSGADKTKLDGIATGAQVNVATDLSYTASTRVLASSTGADVTLPLVSSTEAGLAPLSGGGTANFLRADGTWAAPAGGSASRTGFSQMRPAAGVFVGNTTNGTALGTQAQVANRTVAAPFVPAFDLVIDQLGVSVSTLLAGANCKVVIYAADSNGRPSTVIVESGNISAAAAATAFATISNTTLTAGAMYWIGVRSSGTQTLRTLGVGAVPVSAYTSAATPVAQSTLILTETFGNAAATWTYASSQHSNALMPLVLMRLV